MKRTVLVALAVLCPFALASAADQWLHIKVDDSAEHEKVRVNVPLSLAEKVLPAINHDELREGKIRVHGAEIRDLDLRALFEAVRNTPDNEFVTVENDDENVRVAKSSGNLLVRVRDKHHNKERAENVDVKIPLPVVEALFSAGKDEVDLLAAIRALSAYGNTELVSVNDGAQTVRIWVDSKNTAE